MSICVSIHIRNSGQFVGELVLLPCGLWCLNVHQTWILMLDDKCFTQCFSLFNNLHLFVCLGARGQLVGVRFLLCSSQVLNSFHKAWLQESWSTELSHWFMEILFKASLAPWLCICACICGSQRTTLSVVLQVPSTIFIKQIFTGLELDK